MSLAMASFAQDAKLEGQWATDGVAAVEAAKKERKSLSGLAEGTKIKFKVDEKKGKVTGTITQLNSDKEYDVQDGKITDKTFTFKSVEIVQQQFFNNNGNNNRGGGGGGNIPAQQAPAAISWKGELTDANTVTLTRLNAAGEPAGAPVVYRRVGK
jgi:hypothetical protein